MAKLLTQSRTHWMRPPEGDEYQGAMDEWKKINKTGEVVKLQEGNKQEEEEKPDTVQPGLTYWMRPPEGQPMDDGTMPGDAGYIDPHAGAMEAWKDIDKQGTFGPGGRAPLHSDKKYGQGVGRTAADGSAPMSGNLRRPVHKLKTLSGAAKKGAI